MDPRLTVAFGLALGVAAGCRVPNTDHCLHKAADSNAWCADEHSGLGFCSPCEADNNGCVAQEPTEDECPDYSAAPNGSDTGSASSSTADTSGSGSTSEPGSDTGSASDASSGSDSATGTGTLSSTGR